ncbi:MAG: DUF3087 family protein [Bermanella sp.]
MELVEINKGRYRKHLNIVIALVIVGLMGLALLFGQSLIVLLSSPQEDNFIFNIVGVAMAAVICLFVIWSVRGHQFMNEVVYVWHLKQGLNQIYRKNTKIEKAAFDEDNETAMVILNYYYHASRQLYQLDDNTITLESLQERVDKLQQAMDVKNLNPKPSDYSAAMLKGF